MPISRMSKRKVEGSSRGADSRSLVSVQAVCWTIPLIFKARGVTDFGKFIDGSLLQKFLEKQNDAASPISFFSWHSGVSLIMVGDLGKLIRRDPSMVSQFLRRV